MHGRFDPIAVRHERPRQKFEQTPEVVEPVADVLDIRSQSAGQEAELTEKVDQHLLLVGESFDVFIGQSDRFVELTVLSL